MDGRLTDQLYNLKAIDRQRKGWLVLSAFVMIVICFLIFDHDRVERYGLLWQIGVLGMTVSVVWWYWAMRLISRLIRYRIEEIQILSDLHQSVVIVKEEVRKLPDLDID